MTTQVIYYRQKNSMNTRDTLREISQADQKYLIKVMQGFIELSSADPREEFTAWFNMPNPALPTQPQRGHERNSAMTLCQGVIEKLQRSPNRRDLSPRVCEAIETLSQQISDCYDWGLCPTIQFKDASLKNMPKLPAGFEQVFKRSTR